MITMLGLTMAIQAQHFTAVEDLLDTYADWEPVYPDSVHFEDYFAQQLEENGEIIVQASFAGDDLRLFQKELAALEADNKKL